jgi:SAM-dependent methyltransferase
MHVAYRLAVTVLALGLSASRVSAQSTDDQRPSRVPDCVYVGTPYDVATRMVDLAGLKKGDRVVDPGCGDGRVLIAAARRYGVQGTGYELDPRLAAEARKIAQKRGVARLVDVQVKDIFTVDYEEYNVVLMYLLPDMITRLLPEFEKLKPGSRLVAHDYGIQGIEPDRAVSFISNEDNVEHTVYLYTIPLRRASEQ